jgi:hypothetical protein
MNIAKIVKKLNIYHVNEFYKIFRGGWRIWRIHIRDAVERRMADADIEKFGGYPHFT